MIQSPVCFDDRFCAQCGRPYSSATSPSDDFCGQSCQTLWYMCRAAPLMKDEGRCWLSMSRYPTPRVFVSDRSML